MRGLRNTLKSKVSNPRISRAYQWGPRGISRDFRDVLSDFKGFCEGVAENPLRFPEMLPKFL